MSVQTSWFLTVAAVASLASGITLSRCIEPGIMVDAVVLLQSFVYDDEEGGRHVRECPSLGNVVAYDAFCGDFFGEETRRELT